MDGHHDALLQIAESLATRGWQLLPLHHAIDGACSCHDPECPHIGKHPRTKSGVKDATSDIAQIQNWWRRFPLANIGVATGATSGIVVIDVDPRNGGTESLAALEREFGSLPPTVESLTGGGGRHLFFKHPGGKVRNRSNLRPGIDVKGDSGYIVAPPSTHQSGGSYRWREGHAPSESDLAELPNWLLDAIRAPKSRAAKARQSSADAKTTAAAHPAANDDRWARCLESMLRMDMTDHGDGSSRLFAACCRIVEHDRTDGEAIALIREYHRQIPFPTEWADEEILKRVRDAEHHCQRGAAIDRRPIVLIDTEEHRVVSQSIAALGQDRDLFHRGCMLVRVHDRQANDGIHRAAKSAMIVAVPVANLRERLTRCARFVRLKNGEEHPAHPTGWLVHGVYARGDWPGIRHLTGVSDVPVLHADGSIFQTPGYDEVTGVLYEPSAAFHIPSELTRDDARRAAQELLEVVDDFRFEAPEHRAAWLAGALTPLARFAFHGPAPFFLIDANVRGAGKGLLARIIGWIALGHEMPVSSYSHEVEEMRKKITAIAVAGDQLVLLDNLEGRFGNDALDRALTTTRWRDRLLGKTQQVEVPLLSTWYGTGNNVAVSADTARRIIHIRLDVLEEHPEQRRDFRHADLIGWVRIHRARLVELGLTILAAYCRAGYPKQDLSPYGSFEDWSRLVREAIVWAGLPDPCLTRDRLTATSDATAEMLDQLLRAWVGYDPNNEGLVVADMLRRLYPLHRELTPQDDASVAMRAALENLVGCAGKVPSVRQVGARLRSFRRRVLGGQLIDLDGHRRNGAVWKIRTPEAASMRV